jgi:hypothetical protein
MKKTDQNQQGSAKKLELRRDTLRRLDTAELQHVQGGLASRPRPTTDP